LSIFSGPILAKLELALDLFDRDLKTNDHAQKCGPPSAERQRAPLVPRRVRRKS
jgi:hypothetical protein